MLLSSGDTYQWTNVFIGLWISKWENCTESDLSKNYANAYLGEVSILLICFIVRTKIYSHNQIKNSFPKS